MDSFCWKTHAGYSHCLMDPGHRGKHTDLNTGTRWSMPVTTEDAA